MDSKQRKIRSLRGFFLYALEIMEIAKDSEILHTNLQPFFSRKVKNIIRQNKKAALQEFLFGSQKISSATDMTKEFQSLKETMEALQNQINSLQQHVIDLENQNLEKKMQPNVLSEAPRNPFLGPSVYQQGYSTLDLQKGSNWTNSDQSFGNEDGMESNTLSEASKIPLESLLDSQQYDRDSKQNQAQNEPNFVTLSHISEQDKIEIIKLGFQLQKQGKISLKKYYEGIEENSLFQLKGYSIKYETIRRTKLYQSLKE